MPVERYDEETENQLDRWVEAKRQKQYATSDAIRGELRQKDIDPEKVRPPGHDRNPNVDQGPDRTFDADVQAQLDEWVAAKRDKDFARADNLRNELRQMGVEPDSARPSPKDVPRGSMTYDRQTEAKLENWVEAKRNRDFGTADALRNELRAQGIEPEDARPSRQQQEQMAAAPMWGPGMPWQGSGHNDWTERKLDEWVEAKRSRDFRLADAIREGLRNIGVEPEVARPDGARSRGAEQDMSSRHLNEAPLIFPGIGASRASPVHHTARGHPPQIEDLLERWVTAKRDKDFRTADAIRNDLRAQGVEPDEARPPKGGGSGRGSGRGDGRRRSRSRSRSRGQRSSGGGDTQEQLDRWVEAKRAKDFRTADKIRNALRERGISPDKERPMKNR